MIRVTGVFHRVTGARLPWPADSGLYLRAAGGCHTQAVLIDVEAVGQVRPGALTTLRRAAHACVVRSVGFAVVGAAEPADRLSRAERDELARHRRLPNVAAVLKYTPGAARLLAGPR
ncbi:hypothetical protein [Streptosporangium sp. NPDC001681]|uniref:hypothetical protein n=1 Tax=Streptosporangium sp. NPDC001681 TaxID=3154395 RepID=UPI00331A21B1